MSHQDVKHLAQRRAQVMNTLRAFFAKRNFIEVDTPVLLAGPAPEPHIEAPATTIIEPSGHHKRYLQTSPELPMKRLLSAGLERIFQIAPVFRQEDFSATHRPEFRMLEWYRRGESWESLLEDCQTLLRECSQDLLGTTKLNYQGEVIELAKDFRRVTMDEAFLEHAGFSILDKLDPVKLQKTLDTLGIHHDPSDTWDDLFHRVFLDKVEPKLLEDPAPLFLTHYPAPLAALARRHPQDPRCSERFELYVAGIELANGFGELTCPDEQRTRFEQDRAWRIEHGMQDYPFDERFLKALETLPPSAGIALGVDRLMMLLMDGQNIKEISLIPWEEA